MYEAETARLQEIIDDSENIVFFGGAGVSTESVFPIEVRMESIISSIGIRRNRL